MEQDPKDWIIREINHRKQKNPAYSLRAFARDVNVSKTFISFIVNGHRVITPPVAEKVALALSVPAEQRANFLELCQRVHHEHMKYLEEQRLLRKKTKKMAKG